VWEAENLNDFVDQIGFSRLRVHLCSQRVEDILPGHTADSRISADIEKRVGEVLSEISQHPQQL
jgi:hypothetical protein